MSPSSIETVPDLDLRQIEDVVDQVEQIGPGRVDRAGEFGLLLVEIALRIVRQQLRQDQQRVERRAQLVRHVGEEFGLVFGGEGKLLGLFLHCASRHFDFEVLRLDLLLLILEQLRFLLQLLVRRVQLFLLGGQLGLARLKFLGEELRLFQQALGAHRRGDGVEHDADRFHQLVEEGLVRLVELAERGELDHGLHFVLEQGGQDVDVGRRGVAEAGADADEVRRHVLQQDRALVRRGLANQPFAKPELGFQRAAILRAIACGEFQHRFVIVAVGDVEHAVLRVHQRREFGHDQIWKPWSGRARPAACARSGRGWSSANPAPHSSSVCSFRLRIISLMLSFSEAISPEASTAIDRVRSPLVTAVATSAIDRTWLVRLAASWLTLSVRSRHRPAAPRHARLAAQPALDADLARHVGHLVAEVDKVSIMPLIVSARRRDLALGVHRQLALEVALRHRGSPRRRCRAPGWSGWSPSD